jgi:hypothetical protein
VKLTYGPWIAIADVKDNLYVGINIGDDFITTFTRESNLYYKQNSENENLLRYTRNLKEKVF